MTDRLNVFLRGVHAGVLDWDSATASMVFSYAPEYLVRDSADALSLSLPLQSEPFNAYETRVFFENLLPPEVVRRKLEKVLQHDYRNVFAFLKELGGDCAGAISLYPDGVDPSTAEDRVLELSDEAANDILDALRENPLLQGRIEGYRISVAGAQAKLVARVSDGYVALPLFGSPSTHIVKPPLSVCAGSVENECFCQRLAAKVGLRAAKADILRLDDRRYYVTERYDRAWANGRIVRLLQEDFCQALGVEAEAKYQEDGGPSIARCFCLLRDSGFGFADLDRFLRLCIFNFLIGNADAHGKNFSILTTGDGRLLAPAYDEMSTAVYPNVANRLAMSIGGAREFADVTRESFAAIAAKCEVNPKLLLSDIDDLSERIGPAADELKAELSDAGNAASIYDDIIAGICRRRRQLAHGGR